MTEVTINSGVVAAISKPTAYQIAPEEEYFTMSGGYRKLVATDSEEGIGLLNQIKSIYGNVLDDYPCYYLGHYKENNITTLFSPSFNNLIPILELKFYINTSEAAKKEITVYQGPTPVELPSSAIVLAEGFYKPLTGYSFPAEATTFKDLYFKCDHDVMCQYFQYDFPQGSFRTYYGASLNTATGKIEKVKSYVYNSPSNQAMWDEAYTKQLNKLQLNQ